MARSVMNAKLFIDGISSAISRRGYASAPHVAAASGGGLKKAVAEEAKKPSTSWVPDPVTGFYRPERVAGEIDVAELRSVLLKNKEKN